MIPGIWDFSKFEKGFNKGADCYCSSSTCPISQRKITAGDSTVESRDLNIIFHEKCFKNTKMYQDRLWLPEHDILDEDLEEFSLDISPPNGYTTERSDLPVRNSFWSRHSTKIILGTSAAIALIALGISVIYKTHETSELWHRFCLQSTEHARDLFCCAKQVAADAASCIYQKFEPANFWTVSSQTEQYEFSELPTTQNNPIILSNWTVSAAQKFFRKFF